jgi:hypothetical protein
VGTGTLGAVVEIERVQRPFWMHQLVEYLIGVVLLALAVQSLTPALPAALGALVLVNAAIADGGAGAFGLVGRRAHRVLDLVVMMLVAVTAVQPWFDIELTGRLATGAIAVVLFFVWFHTDFEGRAGRKARAARGDADGDDRSGRRSEDVGRRAGRIVGEGVNTVRRWRDRS